MVASARTRLVAGVAAWAAALGAALVVGLTAVGAIGAGLLGPGRGPLTPAEVDARLASAALARRRSPAVRSPPARRSARPDVIATAGGTVWPTAPVTAEVLAATPARWFRVRTEDDDGGPRIRFRSGDTRFEVNLRCADGRPVRDIQTDD